MKKIEINAVRARLLRILMEAKDAGDNAVVAVDTVCNADEMDLRRVRKVVENEIIFNEIMIYMDELKDEVRNG